MLRGAAHDFGAHSALAINVSWPFTKLKLEHREERVRNSYRSFNILIVFVLASALSLLAQSDRPLQADPAQPLLTARADASPAIASDASGLPDAPSAAKPETSAPAAAPVVKRESRGAPPAAVGGPLSVDRSVADRNYLLVTGGLFGSSVANAELTIRCLQKHAACNDVPSSLQSRAAIYGIGIPADIGIAYLSYHMKKKHSRIWFVPAAAVTGANLFLAVRAYRWTQDPSLPIATARRSIR
jgi:hypothetical protein